MGLIGELAGTQGPSSTLGKAGSGLWLCRLSFSLGDPSPLVSLALLDVNLPRQFWLLSLCLDGEHNAEMNRKPRGLGSKWHS